MNNYERIRTALETLRDELDGYVSSCLKARFGDEDYRRHFAYPDGRDGQENLDVQILTNTMINLWEGVFGVGLKDEVRHLAHQVRKTRNRYAHQEKFDSADTYTSLHEIQRLLEAIGSSRSGEIENAKSALLRDMTLGGASIEATERLAEQAEHSLSPSAVKKARLVLLVSGKESGTSFEFEVPALIGRTNDCAEVHCVDLSEIDGASYISRKHAKVWFEAGEFWIEDLGSSNGTYLMKGDFEKIQKSTIQSGEQVCFGNARFKFLAE